MKKNFFWFVFYFILNNNVSHGFFCDSDIASNINTQVKKLVTKICSIDSLKDSCFIVNNSNKNDSCLLELADFFIIDQNSGIASMPYDLYKKLLLVFNNFDYWDKTSFIENTRLTSFNLTSLPSCNYYHYLFSSSIEGINDAITKNNDNSMSATTILTYVTVAMCIGGASFALGYLIRLILIHKRKVQYLRIN